MTHRSIDENDLRAALGAADIRVLLMVLVHLTGDRSWMEPPFRPKRDTRLIPDPSAGLPSEVQERVRAAAFELLRLGPPTPVITDGGDDLMREMMSATLGEDVPPEYARLTREEMGLVSRDAQWSSRDAANKGAARRVLIVGAGVSGIALGFRLGRLGIPYTIVEKSAEVGGTWHENRYPGAGVDTPSHSYSYSFGSRYRWTRYFSPRHEIEDYLNRAADECGVRAQVRTSTRLTGARWDERRRLWVAEVVGPNEPETLEAEFLVSAIGQFHKPAIPAIPGRETFAGLQFHSANWPDGLSLAGRHVAILGTGASAMQIVPTVADEVASVTVYQRSPQWARPIAGYSDEISEGTQWLLEYVPFYAEWFRFNMFWRYSDGLLSFLRKDPNWPHKDRSINKGNERHRAELVDYIHAELKDRPDLIEKCIPTYPPFGKRILLDNGWYRTLLKPNVHLVADHVEAITPDGIVAGGEHRAADTLVWATGFDLGLLAARLNIVGAGGRSLEEAWSDDNPTAYLGISVPGFPNFFCMLGPNAGLAHGGSVMFQAEVQSRYITACLVAMFEEDIDAIDVRRSVHDDYVRRVDAEHEQLIWTHPGMSTYYRNRHGRVFSVTPWRMVDYWQMTHDPDLGDYHLIRGAERGGGSEQMAERVA